MYSLQELQPMILDWAKPKDLLKPENANSQYLKLFEELGETAGAILKKDEAKIIDGIGDVFVVLVIYYAQTKQEVCFNFIKPDKIVDFGTCIYAISGYARPEFKTDNVFDWLNDFAKFLNLDLTECANIAWNEIKNRTGKTVGGTFIKD
jgi:NTP pyrophosphatase (non-canonical NTP hydrolase)